MSSTQPVQAEERPAVVVPVGELDSAATLGLRRQLDTLIAEDCTHVVVDLGGVSYLGEEALGVLVSAWRTMRTQNAQLRLVCPPGYILNRVRIAGLTRIFPIYPSVTSALADPRRIEATAS